MIYVLMIRRDFALNTLQVFKLSLVGILDKVSFLCLMASLQSSLYHGLLFLGLVEVFGMHFYIKKQRRKVGDTISRVRRRCNS